MMKIQTWNVGIAKVRHSVNESYENLEFLDILGPVCPQCSEYGQPYHANVRCAYNNPFFWSNRTIKITIRSNGIAKRLFWKITNRIFCHRTVFHRICYGAPASKCPPYSTYGQAAYLTSIIDLFQEGDAFKWQKICEPIVFSQPYHHNWTVYYNRTSPLSSVRINIRSFCARVCPCPGQHGPKGPVFKNFFEIDKISTSAAARITPRKPIRSA